MQGKSFSIIEAAQDVLGAILADGDAFPPLGWLKPHHFAEPIHQRIFTIAASLNARGQRISLGAIRSALRGDSELLDLDRVSKRGDYLACLWDVACPPGYAEEMAGVLVDDWTRREIVTTAHNATVLAAGADARPALDVLAYATKAFETLARETATPDSSSRNRSRYLGLTAFQ